MRLSICICTYNRARSLARTLDSLLIAVAGIEGIEIVIVDNNSSDQTAQTVAHYAHALPIRYQFEGRQGLSIARNTAVDCASGNLLLFTDDDTLWSDDSIRALLDEDRNHPAAAFFGGRILPQWPDGPPKWLTDPTLDLIAGVLGHYDLGTVSRPFETTDRLPFGANFAARREALETIGRFDESLGAIGSRRRRGEETDLLQRAVKLGYVGRYAANVLCMHRVDPHNFTLARLFHLGVEKGLSAQPVHTSSTRYLFEQSTLAVRALAQLFKRRGDRFRQCVIRMGIAHGVRREHNE